MTLRAEAEALAASLPRLRIGGALASDTAHLGSVGRRRAGTGEDFWQYRRHMPEDGSQRIDWRRSARSDSLFVRETELETARTFLFWTDPHPGFHWTGDAARPAKGHVANIVAIALASLLSREGERVGVLGGSKPGFGAKTIQRVTEDLQDIDAGIPTPPKNAASVIIFSDFYDDIDMWRDRLTGLSEVCSRGVLIMVTDPVEETFPFKGRVKLSRPGTSDERLLGRAELLEAAYLEKFEARKTDLQALASQIGWEILFVSSGQPMIEAATALHGLLEQFEAA